jgi:hypothetical protein
LDSNKKEPELEDEKLKALHARLEEARAGRLESDISTSHYNMTGPKDPYWIARDELQQYLHSKKGD